MMQSFEEPRCDLRENLLRYGCREASIVYTRGEMRTQQVGTDADVWGGTQLGTHGHGGTVVPRAGSGVID